ncbi:hypothetical protein B8V81_3321 [Paenibacillus pasadenensis]|uniref:Type II secretion system protein GspF domain-containing protein n=1 Tax=Paenibacillus pasadenensis TaxID=217090 RepID=A0A2N5N3K1_9BACL|nr:hypothetical protein [Paenibacillus pasadenensis]PLT44890.1 hypothetical protein B8V81_3321 [Paenibacillus pasadenensis]
MKLIEAWNGAGFAIAWLAQAVLLTILIYALLRRLSTKRPRWLHLQRRGPEGRLLADRQLRLVGLKRTSRVVEERSRLLAGCGIRWDGAAYAAARRIVFAAGALAALLGAGLPALGVRPLLVLPLAGWGALILLTFALLVDKIALESIRQARSAKVIREIHTVSTQLLYLQGSSLHIHAKLMRCVPYTRSIRGELQNLLGEWYHDAGEAIRMFKTRVGTEEAISFAETVDSLRLHEDDAYYGLLRERIRDYKEKLEIAKESRKESGSYVLFILAGLPILYTFQVFIYPWVRESQKLFDSLQ